MNMSGIKLEIKYTGISQKNIMEYKQQVENIHKELHKRVNDEKDFVGWLELPTNYDKEEFKRIKKAAKKNKERIRYISCYRNRGIILRSQSSNRSINKYI